MIEFVEERIIEKNLIRSSSDKEFFDFLQYRISELRQTGKYEIIRSNDNKNFLNNEWVYGYEIEYIKN